MFLGAVTGAVLGTVVGYVGVIGWMLDHTSDNRLSPLGNVPVANLLIILLGTPIVAAAASWLLAGRQPGHPRGDQPDGPRAGGGQAGRL